MMTQENQDPYEGKFSPEDSRVGSRMGFTHYNMNMHTTILRFTGTNKVSHAQLFSFYATFFEGQKIMDKVNAMRLDQKQPPLQWDCKGIILANSQDF